MNVLTGGDVTTALCNLLNALLASGSGLEADNKGVFKNISYLFYFLVYKGICAILL